MTKISANTRILIYIVFLFILKLFTERFFDHNDFMYATSALSDGQLYTDIHYVQAPFGFHFLQFIGSISSNGNLYSTLRFISVALLFGALIIASEKCIDNDFMKIIFVISCLTNYHFYCGAFEIGTYSLAIFLLSLSYACSLFTNKSYYLIVSGFLLGLATGAKINFILMIIPFIIFHRKNIINSLFFIVGFSIGLAPVLYYAWSNIDLFFLHNFLFHSELTNNYRGLGISESSKSVLKEFIQWIFKGAGGVLLIIFIYLKHVKDMNESDKKRILLTLHLIIASLIAAFAPKFGAKQYYVPVTFFAFLATFQLISHCISNRNGKLYSYKKITIILMTTLFIQGLIASYNFNKKNHNSVELVNEINTNVKISLDGFSKDRCSKFIFSLSGAFIIDSGFLPSKYSEAGIFWARLYDSIPTEILNNQKYEIDGFILKPWDYIASTKKVDVILIGFYGKDNPVERNLLKSATTRGMKLVNEIHTPLSKNNLLLYANPACFDQ